MKTYIILATLATAVGLFLAGHKYGVQSCQQAAMKAMESQRANEAKQLTAIAAQDQARQVQIKEVIRYVEKNAPDCFDAPLPDDLDRRLPTPAN